MSTALGIQGCTLKMKEWLSANYNSLIIGCYYVGLLLPASIYIQI